MAQPSWSTLGFRRHPPMGETGGSRWIESVPDFCGQYPEVAPRFWDARQTRQEAPRARFRRRVDLGTIPAICALLGPIFRAGLGVVQ